MFGFLYINIIYVVKDVEIIYTLKLIVVYKIISHIVFYLIKCGSRYNKNFTIDVCHQRKDFHNV